MPASKKDIQAGAVMLGLFFVLWVMVAAGLSRGWDDVAFCEVNRVLSVRALDPLMVIAAVYGREYVWVPVVFLAWVLGDRRSRRGALLMAISFLVAIGAGLLLKEVYYRPRPFLTLSCDHVLVAEDLDSSFPSGHALIVFSGATVAMLYFKRPAWVPLLMEATLVSYSRVYVGVHYPTDVVAGALLGSSISLLVVGFLEGTPFLEELQVSLEGVYQAVLEHMRRL